MRFCKVLGIAFMALVVSSCAQAATDAGEQGAPPTDASALDNEFVIEQGRYDRDVLTPDEEALTDATADDLSPTPEPPPVIDAETDDNWTYTWNVDYPLNTFEQALDGAEVRFTGDLVDISNATVWNTASGAQGLRSDWQGKGAVPMEWQELTISVTMVIPAPDGNTLSMTPGDVVTVAYWVVTPGYEPVTRAEIGSELLVGAETVSIDTLDGPKRELLWLDTQASYITPNPGGTAFRIYSPANGHTWRTARAAGMLPDGRTATVADSINALIARFQAPHENIAMHLGYEETYGQPEPGNPAEDIVP